MTNSAKELISMSKELPPQLPSAQIRWEMVQVADKIKLCPSEPPPILFRGQHTQFSPSYSSISRGLQFPNYRTTPLFLSQLSVPDQAKYIIDLTKSWWFCEELDSHPAMLWAKRENIFVDKIALAQHYELATGYMDLTQSFAVACFFATCKRVDGIWHPKEGGEGIIYRVDYHQLPRISDSVVSIGLQPFPRPAEQWGWVIETLLAQDFETNPIVSCMRFKHDRSVGEYFLSMFNNGDDLFPPDTMSTVADSIKSSQVLPLSLAEAAVNNVAEDRFGIQQSETDGLLEAVKEEINLVADSSRPTMLDAERLRHLGNDWVRRQAGFFKQVSFRLVQSEKCWDN